MEDFLKLNKLLRDSQKVEWSSFKEKTTSFLKESRKNKTRFLEILFFFSKIYWVFMKTFDLFAICKWLD